MKIPNSTLSLLKWSVLIVIGALVPMFVKNDYYLTVMCQVLVNIVAAIGLNFICGLTGQPMLGMAGVMALGAYVSGILTTTFNMNPWLALVFSMLMGVLLGQILGWPSLRIRGIYLALTTIGFSEIIKLVLNNLSITGGAMGLRQIPSLSLAGFAFDSTRSYYYLYMVIVIILMALSLKLINSRWGRAFLACRDNESAVESCGINIVATKLTAFTLCTVYGCIAGSLYAHLMRYINPMTYTFDLSAKFLMMIMLGGLGSSYGLVFGAFIVTALPEMIRFLGDYYWLTFTGLVLLLAIFCPMGVPSLFMKIVNRISAAIAKPRRS